MDILENDICSWTAHFTIASNLKQIILIYFTPIWRHTMEMITNEGRWSLHDRLIDHITVIKHMLEYFTKSKTERYEEP